MHHISLCNINLKKINYNKQKGYKNMVSDMTCLHFSWMTLLLVKEAVSHFFLSPLNFWLWHISVADASGWSSGWVHLPLLDNLGALIRITMTASLLVLFSHQVKHSPYSHKSDRRHCEELTWLVPHTIGTFPPLKKIHAAKVYHLFTTAEENNNLKMWRSTLFFPNISSGSDVIPDAVRHPLRTTPDHPTVQRPACSTRSVTLVSLR